MNFKDNTLSGILRSLIADEFLAWTSYYFYEIISQGKALNFTNKIFEKNGKDELEDHYHKLVTWMQSKAIRVPTSLVGMQEICNTDYKVMPDASNSGDLVQIMITSEQEAIDTYVQAMKEPAILEYPDLVVMLGEICNDEREHLKDLMDVMSNIAKGSPTAITNFSYQISDRLLNAKLKEYSDMTEEFVKDAEKKYEQKKSEYEEVLDDIAEIKALKFKPIGYLNQADNDYIKLVLKELTEGKNPSMKKCIGACYNNKVLILNTNSDTRYGVIYLVYTIDGTDTPLAELHKDLVTYLKTSTTYNFSERINKAFNSSKWYIDYIDEDHEEGTSGPFDSEEDANKFIEEQQSKISSGEKYEVKRVYQK